jgi:hypothetical protein
MSNLCQEITLPSSPIYDINDGKIIKRKIKIKKEDFNNFKELLGNNKEIKIKGE